MRSYRHVRARDAVNVHMIVGNTRRWPRHGRCVAEQHDEGGEQGGPYGALEEHPVTCMTCLLGGVERKVLVAGHQLRELVVGGLLLAGTDGGLVHVVAVQRCRHEWYDRIYIGGCVDGGAGCAFGAR